MSKKIFFCEKPSQAKDILQAVGEEGDLSLVVPAVYAHKYQFPTQSGGNINFLDPVYTDLMPSYGKYGFIYKKTHLGITLEEVNILKAHFKFKSKMKDNEIFSNEENEDFLINQKKVISYFKDFEEIICACDFDHTGIRGFTLYITQYLGFNNIEELSNLKHLIYSSLDKKSLIKSFKNREDIKEDSSYYRKKNYYLKKDYFEYNFNLNSISFITPLLNDITNLVDFIMSKNIILLLSIIQNEKSDFRENDLFNKMNDLNIGTCVTRAMLIEKLKESRLILYMVSKSNRADRILLSEEGLNFLSMIHSDFFDVKILEELENDVYGDMSFEEFKNKYKEKINNLFNKQITYKN